MGDQPTTYLADPPEFWTAFNGLCFGTFWQELGAQAKAAQVLPIGLSEFDKTSAMSVALFKSAAKKLAWECKDVNVHVGFKDRYEDWLADDNGGGKMVSLLVAAFGAAGGQGQNSEMSSSMKLGHELTDQETVFVTGAPDWAAFETAATKGDYKVIQTMLDNGTTWARVLTRALAHFDFITPIKSKKN
jgi:hypothetical protein